VRSDIAAEKLLVDKKKYDRGGEITTCMCYAVDALYISLFFPQMMHSNMKMAGAMSTTTKVCGNFSKS
jgi:hypothetical protein